MNRESQTTSTWRFGGTRYEFQHDYGNQSLSRKP